MSSHNDVGVQSDTPLSQDQKDAYRLVTNGITLIKHGRMHTRTIRTVSVSSDLKFLTWRNLDDARTLKSHPLSSFSKYHINNAFLAHLYSIEIGSKERVLRAPKGCLISFIGKSSKDRSIHFEYANYPDHEENFSAATEWVEALALCTSSADAITRYIEMHDDLTRSPKRVKNNIALTSPAH